MTLDEIRTAGPLAISMAPSTSARLALASLRETVVVANWYPYTARSLHLKARDDEDRDHASPGNRVFAADSRGPST
jgi:hypothetical protein